jgi:hypothetical protein
MTTRLLKSTGRVPLVQESAMINLFRWMTFLSAASIVLAQGTPPAKAPQVINATGSLVTGPRTLMLVRGAQPAQESRPVKDLVLTQGRGTFRLLDGRLTELRNGERLLGHYFQGTGELTYLSTETMEHATLKYNLQGNGDYKVAVEKAGLALRRNFREAVFWMQNLAFPGLPAAQADPAAARTRAAYAEFRQPFDPVDRINVRAPQSGWPLHLAAQHLANSPSAHYLAVELSGAGDPALYTFQETGERLEELNAFKNGVWYSVSRQPVGWSWKSMIATPFLLTHLDLDLEATATTRATLKLTETVQAQQDGLRLLKFNQLNFMGGLRNLSQASAIQVTSVKDAQGRDLPFAHEGHCLLVELAEPLREGATLQLAMVIDGDLLYHPRDGSPWSLGVTSWFPQPALGGQYYTVHARVAVPQPFVPIMPGRTVKRGTQGTFNVQEITFDKPVQFFVVDAGRYEVFEDARPGRTVRVWTYFNEGANQKRIANLTHQITKAYDQMLGPWPWPEFNVIQVLSYGMGQAPPATMYITKEAFQVVGDATAGIVAKGINDRIAHEIAHQYFGHVVKMPNGEEQWITEAFSEYSSGLAMLQAKGDGYYKDKAAAWRRDALPAVPYGSVHTSNWLWNTSNLRESGLYRTQLTYNKGAYVLYDLHRKIGDDKFYTFLFNLTQLVNFKFCTTQALQDILQAVTKEDYTAYFNQYVWGTEIPK